MNDVYEILLPVDLTFFKNAALSSDRFLAENDLLGGHTGIDSFTGGFYSFVKDIERLNSLMNYYNLGNYALRIDIKNKKLQYWKPEHDDCNDAIGFLNRLIIKCNEFLSQVQ